MSDTPKSSELIVETTPRTPLQHAWKRLFRSKADDREFESAAFDVVGAATKEGFDAGYAKALTDVAAMGK